MEFELKKLPGASKTLYGHLPMTNAIVFVDSRIGIYKKITLVRAGGYYRLINGAESKKHFIQCTYKICSGEIQIDRDRKQIKFVSTQDPEDEKNS